MRNRCVFHYSASDYRLTLSYPSFHIKVKIVSEGAEQITDAVPPSFLLPWKELRFERLLGSGSFGNVYKGVRFGEEVAIKQMRTGMVSAAGFEAFTKEVIMLSKIKHPNIVTFVGYVLQPVLLIVMSFCVSRIAGGVARLRLCRLTFSFAHKHFCQRRKEEPSLTASRGRRKLIRAYRTCQALLNFLLPLSKWSSSRYLLEWRIFMHSIPNQSYIAISNQRTFSSPFVRLERMGPQ